MIYFFNPDFAVGIVMKGKKAIKTVFAAIFSCNRFQMQNLGLSTTQKYLNSPHSICGVIIFMT
jgi:hypothetical protein